MKLPRPSFTPGPTGDLFPELTSPASFRDGFDRRILAVTSQQPLEIVEDGDERVHVAVGKSVEKAVGLLQWTFQQFGNKEICILHVHQPSALIPTLLGKLPASQANEGVVSAYRIEEREQTEKLLINYLSICSAAKVKASIITIEADQVQEGIVDLVNRHSIKKLVMSAELETCMKVKRSSSKANYVAKNVPPSCEIWFINKGKMVWTREASESARPMPPICLPDITTPLTLRSRSLQYSKTELIFHPECLRSSSSATGAIAAGSKNSIQAESFRTELDLAPPISISSYTCDSNCPHSSVSPTSTSTGSGYTSSADRRVSSDSDTKEEESLYNQFLEARIEVEASKKEAFSELLKRGRLESETMKAMSKVKAFEYAQAREVELRKEAEDALRSTVQEQEKLLEEKEKVSRELQKTMTNVALMDNRAQEANHRCDEASGELKLIQASIATLRHEKQRIRRQKMETLRCLERWGNQGQVGAASCNHFTGFVELPELAEFSLSDLQTATCNFSESFKIGQGGYGCVYKGEISDKTVAIKKLHRHHMQGRSEFQQEILVLGKLRHPHLVTLLGACPEDWSLVYEYLPKGSLQDHLFRKNNIFPLTWKNRAQVIAEIAGALFFLHSSEPEKIVHGNLKPENILLDSDLSCKICDFGISRLLPGNTLRCPSFRQYTEPNGAFPYIDPEFHRTGVLTPKSDIYSFGIIILQLITGRPPVGLAGEMRRAVSCKKFAPILDSLGGEWPTFVARRLVDLGLQCCELNSRDRPELTPILVRELEQLLVLEERLVPSFFLCPILQEIMHDPQVAADGFTYEGEALRGWLENGRETSPMTNLELSHLHLTPNQALRLAIQDWLCNS